MGFRMASIRLTCKDSPLATKLWNALYVFECVSLILTITLEAITMIQNTAEGVYNDVFRNAPCVGYILLSVIKSHKIVYNRPVHENLIAVLRSMWPEDAVTREEYDLVCSELRDQMYIGKGTFFFNGFLMSLFAIVPYIISIRHMLGQDVQLDLIVSYWFPFDAYKHGVFEVLALFQGVLSFVGVMLVSSSDILFCAVLCQIVSQFKLLAIRIQKIFYVPLDDQLVQTYPLGQYRENIKENLKSMNITNIEEVYRKNIADVVIRHQTLTKLCEDIENEFSFSLFVNFLNSSILICFSGYCCMFVEKWYDLNYKLFLSTTVVQIGVLCWYGQKLIDSSESISEAVYCCGWYNVPQRIKSSLLIILIRAQRPIYVTTYGFSIVSLESFSAILKTASSYLMLLKSLFEE
ncbi:odorant receptor 4-like [Battus philenor]|uniref:odorant receptor 4-like n=1 Tax=Battus philenor TaxID=42288 RepID=UPI0035D0C3C5